MKRDDFDPSLLSEQWVIGAVLLDARAFDAASGAGLTPKSFKHPSHGRIWGAVETLAAACKPIDPMTVIDEIGKGSGVELTYLIELVQGSYGLGAVKSHSERVKVRELEHNMLQAGLSIAGMAKDEETKFEEKLAQAQKLVSDIGRCAVRQMPRAISELAVEQCDRITEMADGKGQAPGWPTHIPSLDRALTGGLRPGSLVILAARPSVGKSSLAQHVALALADGGCPALFLSQEMPASELMDRATANIGRIEYSNIQTGKLTPEEWSRFSEAIDKIRYLDYHIDDQAALTLMDIRTKARMVRGLKLLVVDYIQLCSGEGDTRSAQIGAISRGLKALAKEMGICVIALSQLNRKVDERPGRQPIMSDLRDSGEIEQDADVIVFLWPVRDFGDRRIVGLEVAKNRQGRFLKVGLDFNGAHQRWAESTADISQQEQSAKPRKGGFDDA